VAWTVNPATDKVFTLSMYLKRYLKYEVNNPLNQFNDYQIFVNVGIGYDYSVCGEYCLTKSSTDATACSDLNCHYAKGRLYSTSTASSTCYLTLDPCHKNVCSFGNNANFRQMTCPTTKCTTHDLALDGGYSSNMQINRDSTQCTSSVCTVDLSSAIANTGSLSYGWQRVRASANSDAAIDAQYDGIFTENAGSSIRIGVVSSALEFDYTTFYLEVTSYSCGIVSGLQANADTTDLEEETFRKVFIPFDLKYTFCTDQTAGLVDNDNHVINLVKNQGSQQILTFADIVALLTLSDATNCQYETFDVLDSSGNAYASNNA